MGKSIKMLFTHSQLDNGFNVITDFIPDARAASIHWCVLAGSRYDSVSGTAHFFEHMFASSLSAIDEGEACKRFDRISAGYGFSTGPESISAYVNVLPKYIPEIISTMGKIITSPVWTREIFERERKIILNELLERKANSWRSLTDLTVGTLYGEHPAARQGLGTKENIENMHDNFLNDYMLKHFLAGDMALVVSGPMEHNQVMALAAENFGLLPMGRNNRQDPPKIIPAKRNLIISKPRDIQAIALSGPGITVYDAGRKPLIIMMGMLRRGLGDFLREKGHSYAPEVSCVPFGYSDHGFDFIYYEANPVSAAESLEQVAYFISTPERWLNEELFRFARLRNKASDAFSFLDPSERASTIAFYYDSQGIPVSYEEIDKAYDSVDFEAILGAYSKFRKTEKNVLGYGPCEKLPPAAIINEIICDDQKSLPGLASDSRDLDLRPA